MTQTSNAERQVPTRRISFEAALQDLPRHFAADGDLILSHLAAMLSALFPDGEDFFVRSVRHYRDRITDPDLRRQVTGFMGQEAIHGREHRVLNDRLAELGYPTKGVERFTRWGLETRERVAPASANLAVTAALEHFTATLAELLLSSGEARALFGNDEVRDLFLWHALEESEHKAVAFDVYKAVGGSERMRVWTMNGLRYGFVAMMVVQVTLSLLRDPATYRRGNLRRSWRRFRRSPLMRRAVWDRLRDYNRPDFHPDDHDATALVARWRSELFGDRGSLNDKLAGAAVAPQSPAAAG
jgi:predicted metal-dependent hydrolase